MRQILLSLLLLIVGLTTWSQGGWRPGEMEVELHLLLPEDFQCIQHGNAEPISSDGKVLRAYLTPAELAGVQRCGVSYKILIPDLNQHYKYFWDNQLVPSGYYTYDEIIGIADSLVASYPQICKKIMWGTSIGGRQLTALKISDNVDIDEPEPEILFDGGIHGDEVGASQNIILYARDLLNGYGLNPTFTNLINTREIWLYLMVNPDGRVNMSRYNGNFVDCNRDCGYMWDGEGNSSGAFSQVETKALRDCILDNQFVVHTSYHSGTEIVAYPWSYRGDMTRDHTHINNLASVYSDYSGYSYLEWGQGYTQMYPINGSTKDFVYGELGSIGWSIEISNNKQPPASQISMYYEYNSPAMTEMINRAGWGVEGIVTDSATGEAVRAIIWVGNYFPVYNDPVVGDFHKFVLPGTYAIRVEANGYKTKTIPGVLVPTGGSAFTSVELVQEDRWSGYKVLSCQIPGNNPGDVGFTPGSVGHADSVAYALGKSGWIVVDMGDTIFNGEGNDFWVVQHGTPGKPFRVEGSNSKVGPFTTIGEGTGTTSFDLESASMAKCRYLRVLDTGTGSAYGPGVGFNLDAIEMITPPLIVQFTASRDTTCVSSPISFTDRSRGNPTAWLWSFPGADPPASTEQNPENIVYSLPGNYNVTLTISNGISSTVTTMVNFITVVESPQVYLGSDTTICDWDKITLDAGNPGADYLWSTGDTTQIILIDSTGTGHGARDFNVRVTTRLECIARDTINVTFDNCTGLASTNAEAAIVISPNPVINGIFILKCMGLKNFWFQLLTITGVKIQDGEIPESQYEKSIDVSDAPPGLYFLRIFNENESTIHKIIIH